MFGFIPLSEEEILEMLKLIQNSDETHKKSCLVSSTTKI